MKPVDVERPPLYLLACGSRRPDLTWRGEIQPVQLHRARVVINPGRRASAYLEGPDYQFRADLQTLWNSARLRPLRGELAVLMRFAGRSRVGRSNHQRPDLTNLEKAVEDAGNGFLWQDDRQIVALAGEIVAWGKEVRPFVEVMAWVVE